MSGQGHPTCRVVVTGASGFIGAELVRYLKRLGHWVRAVDIRPPAVPSEADEFLRFDLRNHSDSLTATAEADMVFALAADMGGVGYLATHDARLTRNNLLIDLLTIEGARRNGVRRLLFTSSACVYPVSRQADADAPALREKDAYPAMPAEGYGWAKLMTEQLCARYAAAYDQEYRIVRLHNIYGPHGAWRGGREKAPAALCRKVARAKLTGERVVEIWGDGRQTRSFCYISDCVDGLLRIMWGHCAEPLNLGHPQAVTINELLEIVSDIAGVEVEKRYVPGPQGVRGRNCDVSVLEDTIGWRPRVSLRDGLTTTYRWIESQVRQSMALAT